MPDPAGIRLFSDQPSTPTSTISSDLLQATKTELPSTDGCAHVGLHVAPASWCACGGAPVMPASLPLASMKCRETSNFCVSISTSMSSIMQAEYCLVPCGLMRDPWGMTQVGIRFASIISSEATTETEDGTMSPCRLKLTV